MTPMQKLMVKDGLPKSLLLSVDERRAAWEANPPRPMPLYDPKPRTSDAETLRVAAELEEQRKAHARAKIERMKLKFASKAIDHSKMRWDQRLGKFVEDHHVPVLTSNKGVTRGCPAKKDQSASQANTAGPARSETRTQGAGDKVVTKDNAEQIAKLNGVWKDSYAALRGTGRIVMTVGNVLKGIVKKGGEIKWN